MRLRGLLKGARDVGRQLFADALDPRDGAGVCRADAFEASEVLEESLAPRGPHPFDGVERALQDSFPPEFSMIVDGEPVGFVSETGEQMQGC